MDRFEVLSTAAGPVAHVQPQSTQEQCTTTGDQKIAVIMLTTPSQPTLPAEFSNSAVAQAFFGSVAQTHTTQSLKGYWNEMSYGLTSASGQVFGPFALGQDFTCDQNDLIQTAAIGVADGTVDFTKFTRIVFFFPVAGCPSYAGLDTIGCGSVISPSKGALVSSVGWFPITAGSSPNNVALFAHELGHGLGLEHSSSYDFGNVALGPQGALGTSMEYGDPFSVMGFPYNSYGVSGQYNAQHKGLTLHWLTGGSFLEVQSSGTFLLSPLEARQGVRALRVRRDAASGSSLWIEYRQPIGDVDGGLPSQPVSNVFSGALIHYEDPALNPTHTYLLDFNPVAQPNDFNKAALASGQSWSDPYSPLTLSVGAASGGRLPVTVSYDSSCAALSAPPAPFGAAGGSGSVVVTAPAGCSWNASSAAPWVTLTGSGSGQGNGTISFTVGPNASADQRSGILTVQRQAFPITQTGTGPWVDGLSPNAGTGYAGQFTFQFHDPAGYLHTQYVSIEFGSNNCMVLVYFNGAYAFLLNDSGTAYSSAMYLSSKGSSLSNSKCSVLATGSSFSGSGTSAQLVLQMQFSGGFAGTHTVSANTVSMQYGPFVALGTWTVPAVHPVAGFLTGSGAPALTFDSLMTFPSAGGLLTGTPGVAQAPNGDTHVVGLDPAGGVHLNTYSPANGTWKGWQYSGGILSTSSGLTAAVAGDGTVWFTGRDIGNRFWINSWNGSSFGGWRLLDQGISATDSVPQIAVAANGSVYVVGKDVGGRVWSNRYVPATQTFSGWVNRQGIIVGQPSVAAGQDGLVYVAVRSMAGASPVYMKQIPLNNGPDTTSWLNGGGLVASDPKIASGGGWSVYLMALAGGGTVYLLPFSETTQTFGSWVFSNGILSDATFAAQDGDVYVAGRDGANRTYWYSNTLDRWFFAGGTAATVLAGGK